MIIVSRNRIFNGDYVKYYSLCTVDGEDGIALFTTDNLIFGFKYETKEQRDEEWGALVEAANGTTIFYLTGTPAGVKSMT